MKHAEEVLLKMRETHPASARMFSLAMVEQVLFAAHELEITPAPMHPDIQAAQDLTKGATADTIARLAESPEEQPETESMEDYSAENSVAAAPKKQKAKVKGNG